MYIPLRNADRRSMENWRRRRWLRTCLSFIILFDCFSRRNSTRQNNTLFFFFVFVFFCYNQKKKKKTRRKNFSSL